LKVVSVFIFRAPLVGIITHPLQKNENLQKSKVTLRITWFLVVAVRIKVRLLRTSD
jgi:hypothetical protein